MFESAEQALSESPSAAKAQKIDVSLLPPELMAVPTPPPEGHRSLRPRDDSELDQWASTRAGGALHPFTAAIQQAIVDEERRS